MSTAAQRRPSRVGEVAIGLGALLLAAGLAWGAWGIPGDAGYAGVGPDFLPWVMSGAMALCGGLLLWQSFTGGWPDVEEPSGAPNGDWHAMAWVSAGVLANASLITTLGFVLSCSLCFVLAVRGLRISEGRPGGNAFVVFKDATTGVLIAAPVYWLFTQLLAVNLPGLTGTGWL